MSMYIIIKCVLFAEANHHGVLRLVPIGNSNYKERLLEIFIEPYNGWITICDNNWDNHDAQVACKQLGFGSTGTAVQVFSHNTSDIPIRLDNVNCNGSESRLIDCEHDEVNYKCDQYRVAGVVCEGSLPSTYAYVTKH